MNTWDALRADTQLAVGIIWVCRICPTQGWVVSTSVDAARHDAAAHAVGRHQDTSALADIELRLVSPEEADIRSRARQGDDTLALTLVPPMEALYDRTLSPLQQRIVCDAVGCPPDSRHRRRQRTDAQGPDAGPAPLTVVRP
ncbi:hypothetical protein [Streptomyces globisporus]|uniref:hypothetical protein n=1 Tax=Streptomyces globisporus TaxID=1908 RepID=UPI0004C5455E|nr:hypothetical protein [Streptomyces globisporus]